MEEDMNLTVDTANQLFDGKIIERQNCFFKKAERWLPAIFALFFGIFFAALLLCFPGGSEDTAIWCVSLICLGIGFGIIAFEAFIGSYVLTKEKPVEIVDIAVGGYVVKLCDSEQTAVFSFYNTQVLTNRNGKGIRAYVKPGPISDLKMKVIVGKDVLIEKTASGNEGGQTEEGST